MDTKRIKKQKNFSFLIIILFGALLLFPMFISVEPIEDYFMVCVVGIGIVIAWKLLIHSQSKPKWLK